MDLIKILIVLICTCIVPIVHASSLTKAEISEIAKTAFIWGYPIVDNYSVLYDQALNPDSPGYKAPLNTISHARTVATANDRTIIAPNVDAPYSYVWLDLENQPMVLSLPAVSMERYVAVQLIDSYTYILSYLKPDTIGAQSSHYLIAGPDWQGKIPAGIDRVVRSDTQFVLALYRTELLEDSDIAQVHHLQDQYVVRTLSQFLGNPRRNILNVAPLIKPVDLRKDPASFEFFSVLNWMLASMPVLETEKDLRKRFERIGIQPGVAFKPKTPEEREAIASGMQAGLQEMIVRSRNIRSSAELFGTREFLGQDYLTRAVASMMGIYGNAAQEYLGLGYPADSAGRPFDGENNYRIHFGSHALPPVDGFWSITAYAADRFLYPNAINRHKLSSHMLPQFSRDAEGGITFYIQNHSPGSDLENNWLPVPKGPFILTFRTYLPKPPIRDGEWQAPPVERVSN